MSETSQLSVVQYHEATKHHYNHYARSSGYLDWQNQPNPFRFYEGVQPVQLPFTNAKVVQYGEFYNIIQALQLQPV